MNSGRFVFEWSIPSDTPAAANDTPTIHAPLDGLSHTPRSTETEIFMPSMLTRGRAIIVHGLRKGDTYEHDEERQTLRIKTKMNAPRLSHRIDVRLDPPLESMFVVNSFGMDFGRYISVATCILIAAIALWFAA